MSSRSAFLFRSGDNLAVGSGLLISKGRVITCMHVVRAITGEAKSKTGSPISVLTSAGRRHLTLVAFEPSLDLALLSGAEEITEVDWVPRESLRKGTLLYLEGAPFGLPGSYLRGMVSHTDRVDMDPEFPQIPFVQVEGVGFPGNSGAAAFTEDGRVAGIIRSNYAGNFAGIGFMIPSGYVQAFLSKN